MRTKLYEWTCHSLTRCRVRARRRGTRCDLTRQDIEDMIPKGGRCPVFGMRLTFGGTGICGSSASIDEVVRGKGYVKGNVVMVSLKANRSKADLTVKEIRRLLNFYENL